MCFVKYYFVLYFSYVYDIRTAEYSFLIHGIPYISIQDVLLLSVDSFPVNCSIINGSLELLFFPRNLFSNQLHLFLSALESSTLRVIERK